MKTQLKNRIHSILRQYGHTIKRTMLNTIKGKKLAIDLAADEISKLEIRLLLSQLASLDSEVSSIRELLALIGNRYYKHEVEILMTIPGISYMAALAIISDVVDVKSFPTAKQFCSYLRVAPRIIESNMSSYIGHINRSSRSLTLSIITQSVTHFRNSSTYFGDFIQG